MLLLRWCPFKIQTEKWPGLQFTRTDYLSLVLTPLKICWTIPLTLIPTGEPTSGPHCFRAKYLKIFFYVKNLQKIAKGQEFCSL